MFLSIENKAWQHASLQPISLVMLFGDGSRWREFARKRFLEATAAEIFSEIVFVINTDDEMTVSEVALDIDTAFAEFPVKVIFSGENNIPKGRNLGIREARTEYVMIWDDDDSCDPAALAVAYRDVYLSRKMAVLELPLGHSNGTSFHPQAPDLMPQTDFPKRDDLVIVAMVHTPFIARREILLHVPIPEYVALRGDWLHWSTELYRRGIPIVCLKGKVASENDRPRTKGATASITPNEYATYHVLLSLFYVLYLYHVPRDSNHGRLIKVRYLDRYCTSPLQSEKVWRALADQADLFRTQGKNAGIVEVCFNNRCGRAFKKMVEHLQKSALALPLTAKQDYDVGPFEMFDADHTTDLAKIVTQLT